MRDFKAIAKKAVSYTHAPMLEVHSWQWADDNIDYSRVPNYDTPFLGRFDSSRMPFWKDVLQDLRDPNVREIAVLKCSRAGYSENVVLTDLRFSICEDPELSFYISAKEDLTKGFLDRRIIRGENLCKKLKRKFAKAKLIKEDIRFVDMDFRCTWAANKSATKQDGYKKIYVDEIDLFPEGTIDAIRRRCSAYALHHIVWGGSIDFDRRGNPEEAPILKLYAESDKRTWRMPDPAGGEFEWIMGDAETPFGIKWDTDCKKEDGTWDFEKVRQTAHYITPNGTRIEEGERMSYTRAGKWVSRCEGLRRGYKIVAPMIPFQDCSFGEIAVKFISAKNRLNITGNARDRNRNTLRTFFAEYWARAHRDQEQETTEDALTQCEEDYAIGEVYKPAGEGWITGIYATVDVQKYHLWWACYAWSYNSDLEKWHCALLDFGTAPSFDDLDETLAAFKPSLVGIDIGYSLRQSDVADYCAKYADSNPKESAVIALRGSDQIKATNLNYSIRDALEGRGGGMAPFLEITWATDVFRTWMMEEIDKGITFSIPKKWGGEKKKAMYLRQMTSTKKIDNEWTRTHSDDHLFDCAAMSFVLARWDNII